MRDHCFGGMPVELGWCCGHNRSLNCLEYHRDSEFNLGTEEFILLLARQEEITDGFLDTAKVKAFLVPAGTLIEVYATTLHYAPCCTENTGIYRRTLRSERPKISFSPPETNGCSPTRKATKQHRAHASD